MVIYSHHRLQCFEQCPLKYKFSYIDKIEITRENIEAFLGLRVHEVLEKLYKDLIKRKKNTLQDLLYYLNDQWDKNWNESVIIVKKGPTKKDYIYKSRMYITSYYQRYTPFDQGRTLGLEKRILIKLDESKRYKMQGFIDRLVETQKNCLEIHDYKTTQRLPSIKNLEEERQLSIYTLGVLEKYPNTTNIDLVWHFLAFDKEIRSKRNQDTLLKQKKEMMLLIDKIEKTEDFEPSPSILCRWCEYQQICKKQPQKKNKQTKLKIN